MKRTNCWQPKGKVWFQKNDDRDDRWNSLVNEQKETQHKMNLLDQDIHDLEIKKGKLLKEEY